MAFSMRGSGSSHITAIITWQAQAIDGRTNDSGIAAA